MEDRQQHLADNTYFQPRMLLALALEDNVQWGKIFRCGIRRALGPLSSQKFLVPRMMFDDVLTNVFHTRDTANIP